MVVAEAAAFGVPALVHAGPTARVGVCELLPVGEGCFGTDFSSTDPKTLSAGLMSCLKDAEGLRGRSVRARELSLAWDEDAHARALEKLLQQLLYSGNEL